MVSLVASNGTRDLDGHPAIVRRCSLDSLAEEKRPYAVQTAAAEVVDVRPEKVLHPKVSMERTLVMTLPASRLRSLQEAKEAESKAITDSSSTTEGLANDPVGVSSEKNVRLRSKTAPNPLTQEGLIRHRERSTLWFERGALRKVREERQSIVRETRTGILFHEFEGLGSGHEVLTEVKEPPQAGEAVSSEPAKAGEHVLPEPADAKQEAQRIRNFRQDSAAGTATVDRTDPVFIDMTDLPTRRACFLVMMYFFNKNQGLISHLLILLH